ncbi:MAG TPA: hypothetical protein VD886_19025, partial [Herpetosiphonaceae bacterium]|nr:hypothetical protein [Herpetosiphonaceae bacterium]
MEERSRIYRESANPNWFKQLGSAKADKGRTVFLLHFNIYDVVFDHECPPAHPNDLLTVTEFLGEAIGNRNVVLTYSLHNGIEMVKPQGRRDLPKVLRANGADSEALWHEMASRADTEP